MLDERRNGIAQDVARLEEAATELGARIAGRQGDLTRAEARRTELVEGIARTERQLDDDVRAIEHLRGSLRDLDAGAASLRGEFAVSDQRIRSARHDFEKVRAEVLQAELARAAAASDLSHLAASCLEAFGTPLDDVVTAVERMEDAGELEAPAARLAAASAPEEAESEEDLAEGPGDAAEMPARDSGAPLGPEDVILSLKRKIEKLGAVNMMAIEQFDELETRHTFLTTQRKDLLDSIAQTGEAIRKIDKTTRERFEVAFASINTHFAETFTTLFGGGRAGLVLIDLENDQESGIDIIAQPPGKRLQNVQLLSGGEKALTAMALMFAIFKYRPSPFCLLDEIDAPLDDANIGRFVEMLQGMQGHTQFILITHNRKTMEIADRLYGVTMEEPGVSKLISVQLN
jgi:chromosome segregation protein